MIAAIHCCAPLQLLDLSHGWGGGLTDGTIMLPREGVPTQAFPATQWSLVHRARGGVAGEAREALSALLARYLPALRAHLIQAMRMAVDRADDVLQGFIADKVIEQNLLEHARESKGKLRTFLLVTLERYAISVYRAENAAKRRPSEAIEEIDDHVVASGSHDAVGDAFNLEWARALIAESLTRMRDECARMGRQDLWRIFDGRVVRPAWDGGDPVAYEQLVEELKLGAPLEACALLTTAKRMFLRNLRAVVTEYSDPATGPDEEIADLRRIVAVGGRAECGRRVRS